MPDLSEVSIASTWQINSLYTWASRLGIDMIAVAAGSTDELEAWKDVAMPSYPVYTSEDTSLKEVARGNPSVIYLENGIIRWKSSLIAINTDDFLSPDTPTDPMLFARDNNKILLFFLSIIVGTTAICALLSLAPWATKKIWNRIRMSVRCGGKAHREE